MKIDLTSMAHAIYRLEKALEINISSKETNEDVKIVLRSGAIQAFEFTYELSVKMLKRYLEENNTSEYEIDALSFNDLIRKGYEIGLINA